MAALREFLQSLGTDGKSCRGGMIPWFQRPPTVEHIFLVGDSAEHTFPLTAEGIRFALHFGNLAGRITSRIIDGEISLAKGLAQYRIVASSHYRRLAMLLRVQRIASRSPDRAVHLLARGLTAPIVDHHLQLRYTRLPPPIYGA